MDSNPYSRTAPCRIFTMAVAQTAPGGSVVVLDSAGYGPVTIGQSISLIAHARSLRWHYRPGLEWDHHHRHGRALRGDFQRLRSRSARQDDLHSTITGNETGIAFGGGVVTSRGNNGLQANTTNGAKLSLNDGYIRRPR